MVGVVGIEPTTPSMSPKCSTTELHALPGCRGKFGIKSWVYIGSRLAMQEEWHPKLEGAKIKAKSSG